jgi:two-component system sensor histidine kinase MtrB
VSLQPQGEPGTRGWAGRVVDRWRSSLRLRVSTTTVLVGVAALVLLGGVVSVTIRDGLFEARRDEILADAAARTRSAQQTFDAAIANTSPQVQELAYNLVAGSRSGGSGVVGSMLLRSPDESAQVIINEAVLPERLLDDSVLTPQLRAAVADGGQHWQSISLPLSTGGGPGIIVGSEVTLPSTPCARRRTPSPSSSRCSAPGQWSSSSSSAP